MQATLRLSRLNLVSGARASLRSQTSVATRRFAGRRWNSSHGPGHEQKKSSEMAWVIGSLVTFGPAFLYLVSPSARKTAPGHAAHAHDSHTEPKKVTMKDDEGQEADVTASVQAATADGAKVGATEVEQPQVDEAIEKSGEPATPPPSDGEEPTQKSGTLQDEDRSGPVDLGDARKAAKNPDEDAPKKAETSDA